MASIRSVLCILTGISFLGAGAAQAQTVTVVSGNGQMIPAVHLSQPLVVLVRDASGNPLPNVQVTWTLGVGQEGNISTQTTTTNSTGQATNTFIAASPSLGVAYVQSTATATYQSATAQFTLTSAAIVSSIVQVQASVTSPGLSQLPLTGAAGTQGTVPVTALVQALTFVEGGQIGVANVAVTLTENDPADPSTVACAGGTVLTASSGIGTCNVVFGGKIGSGGFSINVGGLQSFPGFSYKVIAGPPATFAIISGNNQVGNPGQKLALPLVAQLSDAGGNILTNVPVTFAPVVPGAVTLSDVNSSTDSNGRVSAIATLGNVAGNAQVKVSTLDGKASAIFTVTVNIIIEGLNIVAGNQQTITVDTSFPDPLIVQVIDNHGNPVVGAPVTFTVTSGSAVLGSPGTSTGSNGQASTTVIAGPSAGPIAVIATTTSGQVSFSQTFNLTANLPGPQCQAGNTFFNGASFAANFISPGGVATIYCQGIAPGIQGAAVSYNFGPLPTQLANVTVQFDGVYAPIYNVANVNGQESVTVQVPFQTVPGAAVPVTVTSADGSTTGLTANVSAGAPGIFEYTLSDGKTRNAVQVRPDGSFVSPTNPARKGEVISAYVTGLIPPAGAIGTNSFAPPDSEVEITTPVIVGVNNAGVAPPTVFYAPDLIGVWEVQFTVPTNAPSGSSVAFAVGIPVNGKTVLAKGSKMPIQ